MVTLSVNGSERLITDRSDIDEAWIASQIVGRRNDGQSVCVLLRIDGGRVNLNLASAGCGGGAKGGRPPRLEEQRVIDAWRTRGLTEDGFPPGALISFLHQVVGTL